MPSVPYTYLIGWSHHNRWYYGVQYGKKANPRNLWSTYFTSSKYVKQFREQHDEPDVVQVRKCFYSADTARLYENRVLSHINVNQHKWLNETTNKSISTQGCRNGSRAAKLNNGGKVGFLRDEFKNKRKEWSSKARGNLPLEVLQRGGRNSGPQMAHRKWMNNPELKINKRVDIDKMSSYFESGWKEGIYKNAK